MKTITATNLANLDSLKAAATHGTSADSVAMHVVSQYYGDRAASRSGEPYINHIRMGVQLLQLLHPTTSRMHGIWLQSVIDAFCLHPIFQMEGNGLAHPLVEPRLGELSWNAVFFAQEYKKTANAYLCKPHYRGPGDTVILSKHAGVNLMLVADKIQNRIDFEKHYLPHAGEPGFERDAELLQYFKNWLAALKVTERQYQQIAAHFQTPAHPPASRR